MWITQTLGFETIKMLFFSFYKEIIYKQEFIFVQARRSRWPYKSLCRPKTRFVCANKDGIIDESAWLGVICSTDDRRC